MDELHSPLVAPSAALSMGPAPAAGTVGEPRLEVSGAAEERPPQSAYAPAHASAARLTAGAAMFLVVLCAIWGANVVAIKVSNRGFPPVFAAGLRSTGATLLLIAYASARRRPLWPDRTLLPHALAIGALFAGEFVFLYMAAARTSASRAIVLLYTLPFWTAVGAHLLFSDDRMTRSKVAGLTLSFAGILAVFGAGGATLSPDHWTGDLMALAAAAFWGATTLYVKRMGTGSGRLRVGTVQVLFFQLLFSIPVLFALSLALEAGRGSVTLRWDAVLSLVHQTVVVATLSYLGWFWLIERYRVSAVSSFTFLTPLLGVVAGGVLLSEPLPALLWLGMVLVGAGIFLVNRTTSEGPSEAGGVVEGGA